MNAVKKTAIIIINWNGWKDTIECLDSFQWPVPHAHFFILDNDSTDDSIPRLEQYFTDRSLPFVSLSAADLDQPASDPSLNPSGPVQPATQHPGDKQSNTQSPPTPQITLVRNPTNQGFAGGNNVILRHLLHSDQYQYAWLLNNDTVVRKDSLTQMIQLMEREPSTSFCGSVILDYYTPEHIQCCGVNYYKWLGVSKLYLKNQPWSTVSQQLPHTHHTPTHYQIGASLLADIRKLHSIGLMDEIFFLYSEEADWQIRAQKLGYPNTMSWESIIYHKGSISTADKKHLFFYHYNRSAIILTRKNFGILPALTASISLIGITMIRARFAFKPTWFGIKGIIAGWGPLTKTQ